MNSKIRSEATTSEGTRIEWALMITCLLSFSWVAAVMTWHGTSRLSHLPFEKHEISFCVRTARKSLKSLPMCANKYQPMSAIFRGKDNPIIMTVHAEQQSVLHFSQATTLTNPSSPPTHPTFRRSEGRVVGSLSDQNCRNGTP